LNNTVKTVLGLFIFAIINTIYIRYFNIMGITPNINAIVVVLIGLNMGMAKGAYYGLYLGLLIDMIVGSSLGLNALIYMYIGYVSGALAKRMYNESILISTIAIIIADIFYNLVIYCTHYLPKDYEFIKYCIRVLLPEAIYTLGLFLCIYYLMVLIRKQINQGL